MKRILSLCDFSGVMSDAYRSRGYEVVQIDLQLGQDVRLLKWDGKFHGVICQPPCTHFSRAGAWKWEEKGEEALLEGLAIVDACLRCVLMSGPEWWVLENPIGRLQDYLGPPKWKFDPCDFGDPWTKRTWLWGNFTPPTALFVPIECHPVAPVLGDITTKSSSNKNRRSRTPTGFAKAFAECNP